MKRLSVTVLLAGVLAIVAGCSPSNEGKPSSQVLINGAGSTFDTPAFTKWFSVYQSAVDPSARFNYQSIGSGGGQRQLLNRTVDFGASDAPMTDQAMAKAPGKILHVPVVAGGVAIAYNLPGVPKLKFDGATIADIFMRKVKKWNDPAIAKLNPGVQLPDQDIIPVHRAEGSGTTYIFTDYLSSVSPAWASAIGKDVSVKWPADELGGKGSAAVAGQVKQRPGSICYVELAYAVQNKMPYADVKNSAGNYVAPSPQSVSSALATANIPDDFRFSMVNPPGPQAYPIAGSSWVLLYQHQPDAERGRKLVAFLRWAITEGQKISPELDYAPLPPNVQQRELKLLDTVTF